MTSAYILGTGITRFGRFPERSVEGLAGEAARAAVDDAGLNWKVIQQVYAAHVNQGVAAGQRVLKEIGPSGIPVLNIDNCAAAGSTAVREACHTIRAGVYDVVLVVGFEKMQHGLLLNVTPESDPDVAMGMTVLPMRYALMGKQHMERYGTEAKHFAQVSVKNHQNARLNPNAQYPADITIADVFASRMICDPIHVLECSPTSDGAAAVVIGSEQFAKRHGNGRGVRVVGSSLTSDIEEQTTNAFTLEHLRRAAREVYSATGFGPADLDLIETHDCFSVAEFLAYEALDLCADGEGAKFLEDGGPQRNGPSPVNVSGGLLAKGHPLGATGIAQIVEVVTQLRGEAGSRQIDRAERGLTANMGMWSACVTMLEKAQ